MKNKIKYLLVTIAVALFNFNVMALEELGENIDVVRAGSYKITGLNFYNVDTGKKGTLYGYSNYYMSYYTTTLGHWTYCIDPHKTGSTNGYSYTLHEEIGSEERTGSEYVTAYDAAVKYILDNGENNERYMNDYSAVAMALRTLTISMNLSDLDSSTVNSAYLTDYFLFYNLAADWNNEASKDIINAIDNMESSWRPSAKLVSKRTTNSKGYLVFGADSGTNGDIVLSNAKKLYLGALEVVATYAETENIEKGTIVLNEFEKTDKLNNTYTKVITLTANGFTSYDKIDNLNLSINTTRNVESSCYIKYKNGDENKVIDCNDLVQDLSDGDSIVITLVTDLSDSEDCEPLTYTIKYNVANANFSQNGKAYIIRGTQSVVNKADEPQRYITYNSNVSDDGKVISGTLNACDDGCDTVITVPTDCTELDEDSEYVFYITAPDKVKNCIISTPSKDKTDEAGNSYTASSCNYNINGSIIDNGMNDYDDNNYCTVSCKEDYNPITMPGIKDVNSGRYFKIDLTISGVKTCYSSEIDHITFNSDIAAVELAFKNAQSDYNNSIASLSTATDSNDIDTYADAVDVATSALQTAQNSYTKILTNLYNCLGWEMIFPLNAEIKYSYEEKFYTDLGLSGKDKNMVIVNGTDVVPETDVLYCKDIDNDGNCVGEISKEDAFIERNISYCEIVDKQVVCNTLKKTDFPSSEVKYIIQSASKTVEYQTPEVFFNIFPSGEIVYGSKDEMLNDPNINADLVDGLPVDIETESGAYQYNFTITNLGEFYNGNGTDECYGGRLIGDDNSVAEALKIINNDDSIITTDYFCKYRVSCLDCPLDGDFNITDKCPTCLVDGDLNIFARPLGTGSSNNLNPNDRDLGYNWDIYADLGIVSDKAYDTLFEEFVGIYEIGDGIYEGVAILSIELTPSLASQVREYNSAAGTYANNTLSCEDYSEEHTNIFCYSNFFDEDMFDNENVLFVDSRDDYNQYWTVFEGFKIEEYTEYTIGGPSWK